MKREMQSKGARWLALAIVLLSMMACGLFGGAEEPTAVPSPAQPTVQPLVKPTTTPAPKPTPTPMESAPQGQLVLQDVPYEQPRGYFSLNPPVDWVLDEGDTWASWTAPDFSGALYVYVDSTGYELDQAALDTLVEANETNYFGGFEDYQVLNRFTDEFGAMVVEQRMLAEGEPQAVVSIYFPIQGAIYMLDFWASEPVADAYRPAFDQLWEDTLVDPEAVVGDLDPYVGQLYTYVDDEELFSFSVPYTWLVTREVGEVAVIDTFASPDGLAFVQSIKYDEGIQITKSMAGQLALELLRNAYTTGAGDIKITDDSIMPDGSERLTWTSKAGGYSGLSFFETRGTTFLMLTLFADDSVYELYLPTFDTILSTYDIP